MPRKRRPNADFLAHLDWLDQLREVHERCLHKACRRARICQGRREQCITTLQEVREKIDKAGFVMRQRRNEAKARAALLP